MVKIIIADDHPAIRKGVRLILQAEYPGAEFGEAANAAEVFKLLRQHKWDVLIMDMDMPGRNGLEALKQIKEERIDVKTLIFSMHPEGQIAVRALKAGAHGYLGKDAPDGELARAVQTLLAGKKFITPEVAEQMAAQLENPGDKAPHELLSDREYQTLLLFASGKTVSQIAEELSLSVPTISTYRARILEKMGMKNNAELTSYAVRNKLV
jgi:two-component system, NarL family, invasion response regulator UvrY